MFVFQNCLTHDSDCHRPSQLKPFGSFATRLYLPISDLDLVVLDGPVATIANVSDRGNALPAADNSENADDADADGDGKDSAASSSSNKGSGGLSKAQKKKQKAAAAAATPSKEARREEMKKLLPHLDALAEELQKRDMVVSIEVISTARVRVCVCVHFFLVFRCCVFAPLAGLTTSRRDLLHVSRLVP